MTAVSASCFALLMVVLTAAAPRPAHAQGPAVSAADAMFHSAKDAMARRDIACTRFAESADEQPKTDKASRDRMLAVGSFAVGGAGLVTGLVTGLPVADSASVYQAKCNAGCDDEGLAAAARAKTLNVVSPIAFGIGALGLGLGLGAGTYFLRTSRAAARQGRVNISPQLSPQLASLAFEGKF